ncbi:hypothetical protein HZF24_04555 [Sedimentibacter hydroxybenzoicus DSM 7310]|uniref:Zinc finger CHC2-type domain-containing protein n=1 Tax=Sedimentibacter hydroxybenzoicus DSM 7310 TaxID=1123245 RepID=A0A974BHV3_SEDHY|nr:CHC2 zinc finger domain-containing protein [Sedimentibacter hydroxybenzoicus]NYB73407.1 hypothetical protein [Sedimentibacter hydroxybenzoicus DSM 7310]
MQNKIIKCMLHKTKYKVKPTSDQTEKEIVYNMPIVNISIEELAEKIIQGRTFRPAIITGKINQEHWKEQQIFVLDFDGSTIEDEISRCYELNLFPTFVYTTFSHSETQNKFRFVFVLCDVVRDYNTAVKLQSTLMQLFNRCDKSCCNLTRLYFGGKDIVYKYYDNILSVNSIFENKTEKSMLSRSENIRTQPLHNKKIINDNVQAIKNLDIETLQALISQRKQHMSFSNTNKEDIYNLYISIEKTPTALKASSTNDLYTVINSLNLSLYLNVPSDGSFFNCIIPEHNDTNPSAHIYLTDSKMPVYKCFGCDRAYTIIGITEKLSGCSRRQAVEFIKKVYGIEYEDSAWVKEQKLLILDMVNYLDTDEFKTQFPSLSSAIRNRKTEYQAILTHMSQFISNDMEKDGSLMFYSSYKDLMKVCNVKDRTAFSKILVLFALLGMLEKADLESIPEEELNRARAISEKYGFTKLTGFYTIPSLGVCTLEAGEGKARILKDSHITMMGLSRECVLRTFGEEEANRVYPQFKAENKKGASRKSNAATDNLVKIICGDIEKKGYILENKISDIYIKRFKGCNKKQVEIQIKRSMQQILNDYNLVRIRANKDLKRKYGIKGSGYPFIMAKGE